MCGWRTSSWGSGMLEQGFYVVLADFDQAGGRADQAQANLNAATEALKRELKIGEKTSARSNKKVA